MDKILREMSAFEFEIWINSFYDKDYFEITEVINELIVEKSLILVTIQRLNQIMKKKFKRMEGKNGKRRKR